MSVTVGAATDPAETQAEAYADRILAGPAPCGCGSHGAEPCRCEHGPAEPPVLRRSSRRSAPAPSAVDISFSGGRPMGAAERAFFEGRTGVGLGSIRIHDDTATATTARGLSARAFAVGHDLGFGDEGCRPDTPAGRRLVAHELAHVVLGHDTPGPGTVRRRTDMEADMIADRQEKRAQADAAREAHHQSWVGGVERQFTGELSGQPTTIGGQREQLALGLLAQRSAAIDAATAGEGWLLTRMRANGYAGPGLTEVKQAWAAAVLAAESLRMSSDHGAPPAPDAKLLALAAVPAYYATVDEFTRGAEAAHHTHVTAENDRLQEAWQRSVENWERSKRMDKLSEGPRGEPGEGAARAATALMRGSRPASPTWLTEPASVSATVPAARARVAAADTFEQWRAVVDDVNRIGSGMATLVVSTLPSTSSARMGVEYLEQLDARLAAFDAENPVAFRIPAVFFPKDKTVSHDGAPLTVESIPWQFYVINTGVRSTERPATSGGEWVLVDLTSTRRFENREPASDFDSARLQQGDRVDPPLELFSHLNSRIRFPEGRIYFEMPSGSRWFVETTEPWSLSDWLTAIGIALAAIAIVASVIATGGATAAGAVTFYAGLGAAAAGIGSSLAGMHEKSEQGILTGHDVDEAMIAIGIDLVGALSLGLTRLVTLPAAAARLGLVGERFVALQRVSQVAKVGVLAGDLYQAWTFTAGFLASMRALDNDRTIDDTERSRRRGQLIRRALFTGALLAVAMRGDAHEVQAGRTVRVGHVDPEGALVSHPQEAAVHGEPAPAAGAHVGTHPDVAPHGQVSGQVEAQAERAGASLQIGPQAHGIGVAGSGRTRDLYFCSDRCTPIVSRLEPIVEALPRGHPERAVFEELLGRARGARRRLRAGELTPEAADEIARTVSNDLERHSRNSELFAALMNTDPALLRQHGSAIRQRLGRDLRATGLAVTTQAERQAAARQPGAGVDPITGEVTHSPVEVDVLGGLAMADAARPGKGAQPIHFDVGNFSHTYAEALIPGLPRGLAAEQTVTLLNGEIGRADRIRYIRSAEGDVIGAHVYEIKPNTPDNVARGQVQADGYRDAFRARIEADLRAAGKPVPTTAPDGGPLYAAHVVTYDFDQMVSVLRALRAAESDAAAMARLDAIARTVFTTPPAVVR